MACNLWPFLVCMARNHVNMPNRPWFVTLIGLDTYIYIYILTKISKCIDDISFIYRVLEGFDTIFHEDLSKRQKIGKYRQYISDILAHNDKLTILSINRRSCGKIVALLSVIWRPKSCPRPTIMVVVHPTPQIESRFDLMVEMIF